MLRIISRTAGIVNSKNSYSYGVGSANYERFNAGKGGTAARNSSFLAVINALGGGKDLSNGATHWDGADFGENGSSSYRAKQGYEIGNAEHSETYSCNTGYCVNSAVGQKPVFILTAAYGKSIFWKSHPNNTKNVIGHKSE